MASPVAAKSQAMHNFSLPRLKWSKDQSKNHHSGRRLSGSLSPPQDSAARRSPLLDSPRRLSPSARDSASESESGYVHDNRKKADKSEKRSAPSDGDDGREIKEVRSKICIRFRKSNPDNVPDESKMTAEAAEIEESSARTWNSRLRARNAIRKQSTGGSPKVGGTLSSHDKKPQSPQATPNRVVPQPVVAEKKEKKRKLVIPLSKQEIEEDIFSMLGSKPARRPKKRAKNVQKSLDAVFPGLWLSSVTPDSYKVSEAPHKL